MLKQILALSLLFYTGGLRAEKIGVIIGSFGDVDKKEEIKDYVQTTLKDKDILPLPKILRDIISKGGWIIDKKNVYARYESFYWKTHFRENSKYQSNYVEKVKERGYDVKSYIGFSMTFLM